MLFLTNYRLSIAESLKAEAYAEAIVRLVLFPVFYLSAYLTDLVYESTVLDRLTKAINTWLGNEEKSKSYVIDDEGRLHFGGLPKYEEIDPEVFDEALERAINRAMATGKEVTLGDMIEEIKAERR